MIDELGIDCVRFNLVFSMDVAFVVKQQLENRQASSTASPVNSSRFKLERNRTNDNLASYYVKKK